MEGEVDEVELPGESGERDDLSAEEIERILEDLKRDPFEDLE